MWSSPEKPPGMVTARWHRRMATMRGTARAHGARGLLLLAAERGLPRSVLHVEWFAVVELVTPQGRALDPRGDIRWAGAADEVLLATAGGDAEGVRERFARGDLVAVCAHGDELLGQVWFRRGEYDEQGMLVTLGPREAWSYDGAVAPAHRGEGIYPRLVRAAAEDLAASGVDRLLSGIDHVNAPSLRSARNRGAMAVGSILMVRLFGVSARRENWFGRVRYRVTRRPGALVPPAPDQAVRRPIRLPGD